MVYLFKKSDFKILLFVLSTAIFLNSCSDFEDLQDDPKNPSTVNPAYLLSYAQKALFDLYNKQGKNDQPGLLLAQYWTEGPYPFNSWYEFERNNLSDNFWEEVYVRILHNFNAAKKSIDKLPIISEKDKKNKKAIVEVCMVFTWQWLVDVYGDIPYSQALSGGEILFPKYDDAESIYKDLFRRLEKAHVDLDETAQSFENQDLIYSGDVSKWKKFLNCLKIKMAMRFIEVDVSFAAPIIEKASRNIFWDNSFNAILGYLPGPVNSHPNSKLINTGRDDYAVCKTLVDVMNELYDPRRKYYMTDIRGKYIGLQYGLKDFIMDISNFSHVHPNLLKETAEGVLMTRSEVEFFLAEAKEFYGVNIEGSAKDHYNNAVAASILDYGGSIVDVNNYLIKEEVSYETAEGGDRKKAIAIQKWISLYKSGFEGWIEWKRLDYPILTPPKDLEYKDIPRRMKYPLSEHSFNEDNYIKASNKIGGDLYSTKVFWDIN